MGGHEASTDGRPARQFIAIVDHVEEQANAGRRHADPRQLDQRGDGVLLLLQGLYGGHDEHVEVLVAAAVLVHQLQQLLDVAGADVDDGAGDGLQVLLQVGELRPRGSSAFGPRSRSGSRR
jgi:hypothetical protein